MTRSSSFTSKRRQGASTASQCPPRWPCRPSQARSGGLPRLCRGIPTPFLSVSQKRHSRRFKGLFFSSRLQVRLFVKSPLKSPLCRFKRHTGQILRFRLALSYPSLASAAVAMGGEKADSQSNRPFRDQRQWCTFTY